MPLGALFVSFIAKCVFCRFLRQVIYEIATFIISTRPLSIEFQAIGKSETYEATLL